MTTLGSWLNGQRSDLSPKEFWRTFRKALLLMREDLVLSLAEEEERCVAAYAGELFIIKAFSAGKFIEPEETVLYLRELAQRQIRPQKVRFHHQWVEVWFWEERQRTKRSYKVEIFSYTPYLDED